ncbi:MAG TPA: CpsB/CapC family capsule biosynthesis tyrosine phosphatase [Lunatimonas sp.]|nr:CpsB/CapC family capsule biosynthesis tyrosine phosphatase [Lunatimonas sp.]
MDMHSHLIPGIDDGSKTVEESLELIRILQGFGLKKLIMTPHVMSEFYRNTPEIIHEGLMKMRKAVANEGIDIELEAAAEYYMDEIFFEKIEKNQKLLTFGENKVLVETGFLSKPQILIETFFRMEMAGYQPVFAHPERYLYLQHDADLLDSLADRNIFFQLNLLSLTGYYSKPIKKFAEKLIDRGLIKVVGTDCHNIRYLEALERLPQEKYYHKLMDLKLLNPDL